MRLKIILLLFFVVLIFRCADNQDNSHFQNTSKITSTKEDSVKFFNYYSKLNVYGSPFKLVCGLDANVLYDKAPFLNYFNKNSETPLVVAGRVFSNNQFITILYGSVGDDIYPLLYSFNKYGVKVDSLDLTGDCSGDEGYLSSTSVTFKENNDIIKVDSIKRFMVDELGEEIHGTDTTTIFNYKFTINIDGVFIKLDSTKKVISAQ